MRRILQINAAPLLVRDVEDLARFSKEYKGKNGEGLFARAAIITAVTALEHFIELYEKRVGDDEKGKLRQAIRNQKANRKTDTEVVAKWYVIAEHYGAWFRIDVPPFVDFAELVKIRNRLVHLSQKQLKTRASDGTPQLLIKVNANMAEWARDTTKAMIGGFYNLVGRPVPDWV